MVIPRFAAGRRRLPSGGARRHRRERGGAGIHQLDGPGHHLGGLGVLADAAQLLLPQVEIASRQRVKIRRFGHGVSDGERAFGRAVGTARRPASFPRQPSGTLAVASGRPL